MSAYEGSVKQEEHEKRLKYTESQAINLAVNTVKGMGISDMHKKQVNQAYNDGYNQALIDMESKISKMKQS